MYIRNIALRATVLGMVAVAVMATDQPIDWEGPCTGPAVVAGWDEISYRLRIALMSGTSGINGSKRLEAIKLLNGFSLPTAPDMDVFSKVVNILGSDFMQNMFGWIVEDYWALHPCVLPTSTLSSLSSSSDSSSTETSDSSSNDIYSTISSDSSSDIYSISPTTDIYSSAPTSLYSTVPPHKCYVDVVVTSRVIPAYTSTY